ncbi:pyrimidine-nucleoside phosphorylase [Garciella nitratireducens]|uniref:Pyrimidine-nucleoside phosphorylase n=1 Tax=Garciella nitratireducens DSM 15102 TaxID=1121911 RepID=A0A1T4NIF5_9FIRM|nr:pyrimidine-nucleoside phosphorylase [Garciella nitratireducens]RBP42860.1 pyrimidine-nucleoside phosphorylase [Garciella nitratireducens]SJZ78548.1 pyrimidine-nucleoside phosphorylase [Garciella nitratireducens DSM 15102]
MRMIDIIEKKRDGLELTKEEIYFAINGYTKGEIPDYQMSALAMAIYFQDMTTEERVHLTKAMVESGDQVDLSAIDGVKVDKHSTGGVGDTTTLVLAPLVASVGVPIAKMSGRGLGHTGGTVDKLESIQGFQVEIDSKEFIELVNKNKIAVVGQSGNLTPADKKLYALRDVTATVDSIPLIASSIMSKKIASGADAIVLDVKTGSGAFMKELEDAKELAHAMVQIGNGAGRKTVAVISDMNQPLGFAVGNALEVKEAIDTLKGEGPEDLYELCLTLGSRMVYLGKQAESIEQAREKLEEAIRSGKAIEKFKTFVAAQGGDPSVVEYPSKLPTASYTFEVKAKEDGVVSQIIADEIGIAASLLGAGRLTKESKIDLAVGLVLNKKIGDSVQKGESLVTIHSNREDVSEVVEKIENAYTISDQKVEKHPLIYEVIDD